MTTPKTGFRRRYVDPTWVKRHGQARGVYGISPSLLSWRNKRAEGRCRMCQRDHDVRPLTLHHVVPSSWFRRQRRRLALIRNVAANLVPLCRPCHDLVEENEAARSELRRLLAPDEVAFAIQTAGRAWLDKTYPQDRHERTGLQHRLGCHPQFGCVLACPIGFPDDD